MRLSETIPYAINTISKLNDFESSLTRGRGKKPLIHAVPTLKELNKALPKLIKCYEEELRRAICAEERMLQEYMSLKLTVLGDWSTQEMEGPYPRADHNLERCAEFEDSIIGAEPWKKKIPELITAYQKELSIIVAEMKDLAMCKKFISEEEFTTEFQNALSQRPTNTKTDYLIESYNLLELML